MSRATVLTSSMTILILGVLIFSLPQCSFAQPPTLASAVFVTSIEANSAVASWARTTGDFESYSYSISPAGGVSFNPTTLLSTAASPAVTITGLTTGTEYTLTVRTRKGTNFGAAKQILFNTKPAPVLQLSIQATSVTTTTGTLTWGAVTIGTFNDYVLSISPPNPGGAVMVLATVPRGTVTAAMQSLTPGTEYTITLRTKYGVMESAVATFVFKTVPSSVTQSTIRVGGLSSTSATLTWDAVTPGTLDNHQLTIGPSAGGASVTSPVLKGTQAASLQSLTPGTEYTITIKTTYGALESPNAVFKFKTRPGDVIQSSIKVSSVTTISATLAWNAVTLGNFDSYKVTLLPTTAGANINPGSVALGRQTTDLNSLTAGTQYVVTIKTVWGVLESAGTTFTFTTVPNAPNVATIVFSNVEASTATISWGAVVGTFDSYVIKISPPLNGAEPRPSTVPKGTRTTSLVSLTAGTEYTATITASSNGIESSPASNKFWTKPAFVIKDSIGVVNPTTTSATLTWGAVNIGTFDNYLVTMSPIASGETVAPNPIPRGTQSTDLKNLVPGNQYTINIKTRKGALESRVSTYIFITLPTPVNASLITFTNINTGSATVNWAAATGIFAEYVITINPKTNNARPDPTNVPKGNALTTSLRSLTAGTTYTVDIRTRQGTSESTAATKLLKTRPVAVTSSTMGLERLTPTSAALVWAVVHIGTVDKYLISLTPTAGSAEAFPNAVNVGSTTTNLVKLTPGTLYTVSIKTMYGTQEGATTTFSFRTLPPNLASEVSVTAITTSTATATWSKTDGSFDSYSITITPDSDGEKVDTPVVLKAEAAPRTTLSNLKPGRTYTVLVSTKFGTLQGIAKSKSFATKDCPADYFRVPGDAKCSACHCIGTCFPTAGCTDSACSKGYRVTPLCQLPCEVHTFGFGCQKECHCKPGDTCSHISGVCPKGCHPNYWGADCQKLLPGLIQTPSLTKLTCNNVTVQWHAFEETRGDTSNFPISRYLLQMSINDSTSWLDQLPYYRHEVNKTYSHLVSNLQAYTRYKFRVRTDANITIEFPALSYVALPGRPSPETANLKPPCATPKPTPTITTTTTTPTTTPLTTTTPAPGAPTVPLNLRVASSSPTIIDISWEPPTSVDQTTFVIFYGKTGIGDCETVSSAAYTETEVTVSGSARDYKILNLQPWSNYKISVRASNLNGKGVAAVQSTRTKEAAPTGKCTSLQASGPTASTFDLSFTPPPCATRNGALKSYRVKTTDPGSTNTFYVYGKVQVSFKIPGLNPDTSYTVAASFVNNIELESPFSDAVTVKTAKWTIIATPKPSSVELGWQPLTPKTNDVLGNYNVTYWEDKVNSVKKFELTPTTSIAITNLPKAIIIFQVAVTSTLGWNVQSETTSVNTINTVPSQPTTVTMNVNTENGIAITWTAPLNSASEITHYRVDYQSTITGLAGGTTSLKNISGSQLVPATQLNINLSPLDPATTYKVSVHAKNSIGFSDPSVKLFSTQPGTPDDPLTPKVTESTTTTVTLTLTLPTSTKGPVTKMAVVVEKASQAKRKRRAVTLLCTKTPSVTLVPGDFKEKAVTVVVGSGAKGSTNAPLEPGTKYNLCYQVGSTYEGVTKIAANTFNAETKAETNIMIIIIIVVVVILLIIIIVIIVVVVLLLRKRRRDAGMNESLWTMDMDKFDETMYNVKPYGKWSDVHRVGEPRHIELVKDSIQADPNIIPIEDEYHKLPHEGLYTWDHAVNPQNSHNNRFNEFLPYDHSRVVLSSGKHDYINANYIDGYKKPRAYIAAQSPFNTDTVCDFWQMVCQENTTQIVMLGLPLEEGVFKCEQYWPDTNKTYGGIKVKLLSTETYAYFCIRTFEVVPNAHSKKTVTQCHFTGWPMRGNPDDPIPLLDFIYKVRSLAHPGAGPVVVHCGTGVSRTSVYIAVDSLIKEGRKRSEVKVFDFCSEMRQNRYGMVRTLKQYIFIYDTLYEALLTPDSILDIDMRAGYHALISKDPATGHTHLYEQFKIFRGYTPEVDESKCRMARLPENKRKNRFPNIVPEDEFSPKLKTPGGRGRTDYINALILDSYTRKDAFIVTQTPLKETVVDFWKLVYDYKISTIVMLHDRTYKEESSAEYWPKALGSVRFDPFVVTLRTYVKERDYVISRTMDVNNQIRPSEKAHEVKMFQLDGDWMMYDHVPKSRECLLQLIDAVFENRKKSADHPETPILVHCIDGGSRSGLFVCLMNLVERMQIDRYADVFHAMKHLKRRRSQFVDDLDQYRFCHKALWDFINTRMIKLPQSIPRNDARNGVNGTANGRGKSNTRDKRHLELTLAANDLNNYDYTLSVA